MALTSCTLDIEFTLCNGFRKATRLTDEALIAETPSGVLTIKPIIVKNTLTFIAQSIAAAVVVWAYLWTLEIVGL